MEDLNYISELMGAESDRTSGGIFDHTILDGYRQYEYGPERERQMDLDRERTSKLHINEDPLIMGEAEPIENEQYAFFNGQVYMALSGGFIYILSLSVKEGLEVWIMGVFLLLMSTVSLALWLVVIGPSISWFVDPQNELDRGWHNMWQRVNLFFSTTLAFVVVQVGSDLFLSTWKKSGVSPYEAVLYLLVNLTIFYGTLNLIIRLPAAQAGRRSLYF